MHDERPVSIDLLNIIPTHRMVFIRPSFTENMTRHRGTLLAISLAATERNLKATDYGAGPIARWKFRNDQRDDCSHDFEGVLDAHLFFFYSVQYTSRSSPNGQWS